MYNLLKKETPYTNTVVCFAVQKIISNQPESSVVQFEEEVLNLGESFDIKKSVFKAPKEGVYEFFFTGYKRGMHKEHVLKVSLRLNGKAVVNALAENPISINTTAHDFNHNFRCPISMYTLLKLKKGDQIDVFKSQGNLHVHDSHLPFTLVGSFYSTKMTKVIPRNHPKQFIFFYRKQLDLTPLIP